MLICLFVLFNLSSWPTVVLLEVCSFLLIFSPLILLMYKIKWYQMCWCNLLRGLEFIWQKRKRSESMKYFIYYPGPYWTAFNPFSTNVPLTDKPGSWLLLAKCLKNTCRRVKFFKHFASNNQLPGFHISETLVENGFKVAWS